MNSKGNKFNLEKISKIRETLLRLGLINEINVEIYSENTRDKQNLRVYKDNKTKIIFIDEYYVGDKEYENGDYRNQPMPLMKSQSGNLEDILDNERRYKNYRQFVVNKNICDYGCGEGNFLRLSKLVANSIYGIEIQKNYNNVMNNEGIKCFTRLDELTESMDTVFFISLFRTFTRSNIYTQRNTW